MTLIHRLPDRQRNPALAGDLQHDRLAGLALPDDPIKPCRAAKSFEFLSCDQALDHVPLGELAGGATVWLAVTGLSRSGKTVFITSLIHNLLSSAHNPNRMPLLGVVGERRLIAATVEGAGANRLPRFPYLSNIEKMAIPDWPARTADISEIGIEVRFAPAGTLGKLLSGITMYRIPE